MSSSFQVVIAGGGSPGHLYPGLAIAESLQQQIPGVAILFAGTGRSFERHLVRSAGYNYVALPAKPAPQNALEAIRFVTDNVAGFCAARWMLGEQETGLVVGLGGYASASVVRAAVGRGIPTLLLEQDAVACRTTRWLSSMVETVCTGFPGTESQLSSSARVVHTGVPVRPAFLRQFTRHHEQASPARTLPERRLVILGGAGGANTLNVAMPPVISQLSNELSSWRVVHQTGEGKLQETENRYGNNSPQVLTISHIDELASLLSETDLVVCRGAATQLAELALAGVPAIVVPFPEATDQHQLVNAQVYQQAGGAVIVDELAVGERLVDQLACEVRLLTADHVRRGEMSQKMAKLAQPEAASAVARECCDLLCVPAHPVAA